MNFEFDDKKSIVNNHKYGITFNDAKRLWNDDFLVEIPAKTIDEERFLVIGKIQNKHWSGVVTYRNDKIGIISVKRSRKKEIEIYESQRI